MMKFEVTKDGGRILYAMPEELFCWGCGIRKDLLEENGYYYDVNKKFYCRECATSVGTNIMMVVDGKFWMIDELRYGGKKND